MRSPSSGDTSRVTTVEGIGLPSFAFSWSIAGARGEHLDIADDHAGHAFLLRLAVRQRHHDVDASAGDDEAGHADHFVDLDRDGAHALRNRGRQASARLERRQFCRDQRFVLLDRRDEAAVQDLVHLREGAGHLRVRRPLDQLDVVLCQPGAERQRMLRDDDVDGLDGAALAGRPRRHHAIHAETGHSCQKHRDEDHYGCAFVPIHLNSPSLL